MEGGTVWPATDFSRYRIAVRVQTLQVLDASVGVEDETQSNLGRKPVATQEPAGTMSQLRPLVLDGLKHFLDVGAVWMESTFNGQCADAWVDRVGFHERSANKVCP